LARLLTEARLDPNRDPYRINADLHCHSHVSDGVLAPAAVVERAAANGVQILALTDHDELGGLAAAKARATELGLAFVCGVEISITFAHQTVHIVGLNVDPHNAALKSGLEATRGGRAARARLMAQGLAQAGIAGGDAQAIYTGALTYVGNPELISRTHLARYLVEKGVCSAMDDVFFRYLTEGKPGYVPHRWATLSQAVRWIKGAGGQAVIAHPARYRFTPTERHALFEAFKELGGVGLEVITASHTRDEYRLYAQVAKEYGFLASRGSDFHSPTESRLDLGEMPLLPDSVIPLWHDWPQVDALAKTHH
jgi:predicted metal-dependent phosphoesterase TrpH